MYRFVSLDNHVSIASPAKARIESALRELYGDVDLQSIRKGNLITRVVAGDEIVGYIEC